MHTGASAGDRVPALKAKAEALEQQVISLLQIAEAKMDHKDFRDMLQRAMVMVIHDVIEIGRLRRDAERSARLMRSSSDAQQTQSLLLCLAWGFTGALIATTFGSLRR